MRVMRALCDGELNLDDMQELKDAICTMPCRTAECERDFSLMNITAADFRSSLTLTNIASFLFIDIDDPPLSPWNPKDYV